MLLGCLTLLSSAEATQLSWDGHYRTRAQYFNSLSLSESNPLSEGASRETTHRLRLQPTWSVDHRSSVTAQLDLLPYTLWGTESSNYDAPATADELFAESGLRNQSLQASNSLQVRRLWAEHQLEHGWISFGRMPHHWGSGMLFHHGNDPLSEFGSTVDRVALGAMIEDVMIQASLDRYDKGLANDTDGVYGGSMSFLYQNETAQGGLYTLLQKENADDATFSLFTIDLHGATETGPLTAEIELAYQYGKGDLSGGIDDIRLSSVGGLMDLGYQIDRYRIGLAGGFAQGDKETADTTYNTFSFNPDLNLGMLLFEEPLPTLSAANPSSLNNGREYGAARTDYSVRNALYIKPTITAALIEEELEGSISFLAARAFSLPEEESGAQGYGMEIDANVRWAPTQHFDLSGTAAYFIPGTYYSSYTDSELGGNFNSNVLGLQLLGTAHF